MPHWGFRVNHQNLPGQLLATLTEALAAAFDQGR